MADPEHCCPPLDGGGFVQLRFLVWLPPPQVTVHGPQALQSDQPPSTGMKEGYGQSNGISICIGNRTVLSSIWD